ncbi:hypothetical protein DXG03_009655 [Asterophora parasitica]|uniref:Uncharacterized protein n=1 Tax=Asterophora parasitica TaxID=117018 RepID=A0A9P7G611_9AGAR|nr:hypothetical protein DXG03_009655 [Asterophora parasitica]
MTLSHLPVDFLIRLAPMRLPASLPHPSRAQKGNKSTFIPDGLQHSQFTVRRSDKATYILCSRSAVPVVADPSNRGSRGVSVHPLLADHIAHLLRLRVLQELELLADTLDSRTKHKLASPARIIRRLTRSEWDDLRTTGTIPYPNALAVMVVPPLQKDPITKLRPQPWMSAAPLPPDPTPSPSKNVTTTPMHNEKEEKKLSLCTLHPVAPVAWDSELGGGVVPEAHVPLYNGVALFPKKPQRAALHALLTRLLGIERASRHSRLSQTVEGGAGVGGRASHAFVLCGDKETVLRGDVAAVAIALWRVRMFEDEGDDVAALWEGAGGWERTARPRP